ncbi:MAG: hypothetical protein K8H90_06520 [Thermoanaerobaculia bacterium]|nr:hypothetical protein [Thermoanaerobaculia bacterium]
MIEANLDHISAFHPRLEAGLFAGAVVTYARSFITSRGRDFATPLLTLDDLLPDRWGAVEHFHNRLLDLRHRFVAHSDASFSKPVLVVQPDGATGALVDLPYIGLEITHAGWKLSTRCRDAARARRVALQGDLAPGAEI